jgi:hypothetical protein
MLSSQDGKIVLQFARRNPTSSKSVGRSTGTGAIFVLGDDSEFHSSAQAWSSVNANCAVACLDLLQGSFSVRSSVVGLPPVFVYRHSKGILVASDLYLLSRFPSLRLRFDKSAVLDLFRIGHPVQHRTLFENVSLMPAGYQLQFEATGRTKSRRFWQPPRPDPMADWEVFLEAQSNAFLEAMRRLDKASTVLSLTAGLDTRTILAALIRDGVHLPTVTLSGDRLSLDARIAAKLSRVYDLQHEVIRLDNSFFRQLPEYVMEASRLSGGVSGIEQADEVFFNHTISKGARARLSGNLGNQVGRGGTEKISMRAANPSLLGGYFTEESENVGVAHWYSEYGAGSDTLDYEFLLQQELPFSSVGNYGICNHFLVQRTPYADTTLIEAMKYMPCRPNQKKRLSLMQLRLKDLRHRFMGEPERYSFQRNFIREVGGFVAECPLNWGWKASGGFSSVGVFYGIKSFLDMGASSSGWDSSPVRYLWSSFGITGMHQFKRTKDWFRGCLKDFVHDTLLSNRINADEFFDQKEMNRQLKEHYSGIGNHYKSLTTALTLCIARKVFSVSRE